VVPLLLQRHSETDVKVALLPAKPLPSAKTRLGPLLDDHARMTLAGAMFGDVLAALCGAAGLDAVVVVTADATLAAHARSAGAVVVDEGTARGLNGAVSLGTDTAIRLGASTVLVLLSDVPLVKSSDIEELLARAPRRGALVVPSKEGTGTNAMLRQPPSVFAPCFGGRSLERHVATAERADVPCEIVRSVRLGFDLDTPEDLRAFAALASPTTTHRELMRVGAAAIRATV
jgi:2-phospho-L-lactate guanylyltransferase